MLVIITTKIYRIIKIIKLIFKIHFCACACLNTIISRIPPPLSRNQL